MGSVRFEVIDPPSASFAPVSPNRYLLIAAVFAASIAAGIALAYGLDLLRPVFNSSKSLADFTGIPVFGAVSVNLGPANNLARRWGYLKYAAACSTLLFATVAVLFIGRMINHGGGSHL